MPPKKSRQSRPRQQQRRRPQQSQSRKVETSYTIDPLSDLASASELRIWRNQPTTQKVFRYLARWRMQLVEHIADGGTTAATAEATAQLTAEGVSKAQLLKDLLAIESRDIADFYGLAEPKDPEAKK